MTGEPDDRADFEAERLLRSVRPSPRDQFVAATERRLLGCPRGERRSARRPLLAGLGMSGALAATIVVAGLAGAGPLAPGGDSPGHASQDCHTVTVVQPKRIRVIVRGVHDRPVVVKRVRLIRHTVRTCP